MSVSPVGTLITLSDGSVILASDHNTNYAALKAAFNALVPSVDTLAAMTLLAKMGTSSGTNSLTQLLRTGFVNAGNVGAADTDVDTVSLPANSLDAQGKGLRLTAWGSFASNGNAKSVKLTVGNQQVVPINADTTSGGLWYCTALVQRGTTTTSADGYAQGTVGTTLKAGSRFTALTNAWTSVATLKWTLAGTSNNDVILVGVTYEYLGT